MLIRKMNTVLVKHNKVLFGIFSFVIIVAFVWFFTPGLDGSMFFGGTPGAPGTAVAQIRGKKITLKEYRSALTKYSLFYGTVYGINPHAVQEQLSKMVFGNIANEMLAKEMGIVATDAEVAAFLKEVPAFRKNGKFDMELYKKYAELLKNEGYTIKNVEDAVRDALAGNKAAQILISGVFTTPGELREVAKLRLEKFQFYTVKFPLAKFAPKSVTEAALLSFYKENPKMFETEPVVRGEVVKFDLPAVKKNFTAKEIETFYNANQSLFQKNGKVQPLASVKSQVVKRMNEQESGKLAAAAAGRFRDALYDATSEIAEGPARIDAFRKLAAQYKLTIIKIDGLKRTDPTIKGIGTEPYLAAELFKATAYSPLTPVVAGTNGYYVAAQTVLIPSKTAEFASVKGNVKKALVEKLSRTAARQAANNYLAKLINSADPEKALTTLSKEAKVEKLPVMSRMEQPDNLEKMLVLQSAGSLAEGKALLTNSVLPDNELVVFLSKRIAPDEKELEKTAKELEPNFLMQKRQVQSAAAQEWLFSGARNYMEEQEKKQ